MIPWGAFWSKLGWGSSAEPEDELGWVACVSGKEGCIMLNKLQGQVLEIIITYTVY